MYNRKKRVDIIIPIYNAYEDLVKCVSSVWRHTDLHYDRLILVNDKSPDPRIEEYLGSIEGENILVHNSEENGGFSASVNIGMGYSDENDVLLLNSDTIVTANWMQKIQECAYSDDSIATVTPLSNAATLASFPIFGQDNQVPDNVTVDELAEIVERCSFKDYPQITVAVGFCMYIKREVLDEIGVFDAATFGRGYGEENDFCCRAELMGYKHVLCDNTFVYHKGTGSFLSEQKKALIAEHIGILEKRYPAGMLNNHMFCMSNPYQYIRDNIAMYLSLVNGKKNILYILHDDFEEDAANSVGGTQLHVKDLKVNLLHKYNIYVLAKENKKYRLTCYVDSQHMTFEFRDENVNIYPVFRDVKQKKMLENILSAFKIDFIHVHHISKMSLDIYYVAKDMNIPIVTSIHDFYTICPTYFLYNVAETVCTGCPSRLCDECLQKKSGIYNGLKYIEKWRHEMQEALKLNSVIIFPSHSAKNVFQGVYAMNVQLKVIGHGITEEKITEQFLTDYSCEEEVKCCVERVDLTKSNIIEGWAFWRNKDNRKISVVIQIVQQDKVVQEIKAHKSSRQDVDDVFDRTGNYVYSGFQARVFKEVIEGQTVTIRILMVDGNEKCLVQEMRDVPIAKEVVGEGLRVAFIGGLSAIKGSGVAYDMVTQASDIEWFVLGNIAPDEKLANYEAANLHKLGAYERKDIKNLLQKHKIDVVCILSRCSETFCYTLSEAMGAMIPIIAYNIGAVGERIRETGTGILISVDEKVEVIIEKIRKINLDKEWADVKVRLEKYQHKTSEEMAEEYSELYESLFTQKKEYIPVVDALLLKNAYVK